MAATAASIYRGNRGMNIFLNKHLPKDYTNFENVNTFTKKVGKMINNANSRAGCRPLQR